MKKTMIILVLLALFVGCSSDKGNDGSFTSQLLVKDKVIIGITPDYPPFEFLDDDKIVGYEIDMIEKVIEILNKNNNINLSIEFKPMDFGLIIGALETKQIDIGLSGFTYSPDRDVLFSETHVKSKQVIIVANQNIKTFEDLKGKKIGAGLGTTGEAAAKEQLNATVTSPGDYSQQFAFLKAGQLDAVVADEAVGDNYVREMGFYKLEQSLIDEEMKIIFNKVNDKLLEEFNKAIIEFKATPDFKALQVKWKLIASE